MIRHHKLLGITEEDIGVLEAMLGGLSNE
jgi:hypothetical protein